MHILIIFVVQRYLPAIEIDFSSIFVPSEHVMIVELSLTLALSKVAVDMKVVLSTTLSKTKMKLPSGRAMFAWAILLNWIFKNEGCLQIRPGASVVVHVKTTSSKGQTSSSSGNVWTSSTTCI